jgi:hypothetical protein
MQSLKRREATEPGNLEMLNARTSFPEAVDKILETTPENKVVSISELAHMTSLNRKTVEKGIDLIMHLERKLGQREFILIEAKGRKLVSAKRREPGLLSLPLDLQKTIIRSVYFPLPSRQEEILTYLYLRDARNTKSAVFLPVNPGSKDLIDTLVAQGHIAKAGDHYYLTDDGYTIAVGALDLYPELKEVNQKAVV